MQQIYLNRRFFNREDLVSLTSLFDPPVKQSKDGLLLRTTISRLESPDHSAFNFAAKILPIENFIP